MNKKTILVAITGVLLAVAGGAVGATLSRYQSEATTTPQLNVAKWAVKVNEVDITENGETTLNDLPISWTNELAAADVMAPGSTGTMTLTIDANGTQVPVDYEIQIDTSSLNTHSQIKIEELTSKIENDNENSETKLEKESNELQELNKEIYKGTIPLDKVSKKVIVTIKLKWENNNDNNVDDTTIGSSISSFNLPIKVIASQHLSS